MKKLLYLIPFLCVSAFADTRFVLPYEEAATINFEMYDSAGLLDIDEVDSGTEVTVHCNEDAGTTATNDFVDEGTFYSLSVTAAELTCARVTLAIAATLNHLVFIETCGSPNAQHELCPGGFPVITSGTAQAGSTTTTTVLAAATAFGDDELNGYLICHVEDLTAGDPKQCRVITDYVLSTDTATHGAMVSALPTSGEYQVIADPRTEVNASGGVIEANVINIEGTDATDTIDGRLTAYDAATGAEAAAIETKVDTVDTVVDAILVDTAQIGVATDTDIATDIANVAALLGIAEPGGVPAFTADAGDVLSWLLTLSRNEINQTATTKTIRNDADTGNIATCAVSDDGTTFTRAECL